MDCKHTINIQQLFSDISTKFLHHGIPSYRLESEVIIRHILSIDRACFFTSLNKNVPSSELFKIEELVKRRLEDEPLFYILGKREFYGIELNVTKNTLIPRQETELLVEIAIKQVANLNQSNLELADIGTGSGAIAIALAKNIDNAMITATDSQPEAIKIAKHNASSHQLSERINFMTGDLFSPLDKNKKMDLIISNPPYIPSLEIKHLPPEVKREPVQALDGGDSGLLLIERILSEHHPYLKPNGSLILEFGKNQITKVISLAEKWSENKHISTFNDYSGIPRAILIHC